MEEIKKHKHRIGDKVSYFYTAQGLADYLELSRSYLMKLEERGILPKPNFRYRKKTWAKTQKGHRIYSVKLAEKLKPLLSNNKQGTPITDETKRYIMIAFQEEKKEFIPN